MGTKIEISLGRRTGEFVATTDEEDDSIRLSVEASYPDAELRIDRRPDDGADVVVVDGDRHSATAREIRDSLNDWKWQAEQSAAAATRPQTYAVWQEGTAVFGTGSTEELAIREATSYAKGGVCEPEKYVGQSLVVGELYVAPCSDALARYVADHGGHVKVAVEGRTLKLGSEIAAEQEADTHRGARALFELTTAVPGSVLAASECCFAESEAAAHAFLLARAMEAGRGQVCAFTVYRRGSVGEQEKAAHALVMPPTEKDRAPLQVDLAGPGAETGRDR